MAQKKVIKVNLGQVADLDKLESLSDKLFVSISTLEKSWYDSIEDWNKAVASMLEQQAKVETNKKDAEVLAKTIEASFKSIGVEIDGDIASKISYIKKVYPKIIQNVKDNRQEIKEKIVAVGKLVK
jgi:hypothetical protein